MSRSVPRVAVVVRAPSSGEPSTFLEARYPLIEEALSDEGMATSPLLFGGENQGEFGRALREVDAALVWVDPLSADGGREELDSILRDGADHGVVVYTHPDTIEKIGTKDVLFETRHMTWSSGVERYENVDDFVRRFPSSLRSGPRVVKPRRGNGGKGVWKVTHLEGDLLSEHPGVCLVEVQHAAPRDGHVDVVSLDAFVEAMITSTGGTGLLIDQAFEPRVAEGLIRAYLVKDEVVGFARQYTDVRGELATPVSPERVFGVPSPKTMFAADEPEFVRLRRQLTEEWLPQLRRDLDLSDDNLPLLWDTDFLLGPLDSEGLTTYRLCEINVSCVTPFPPGAPRALASRLARELRS